MASIISFSAPVVYTKKRWSGNWSRTQRFDIESIELNSGHSGHDIATAIYRYGRILYPNSKKWENVSELNNDELWIKIEVDGKILFQGVSYIINNTMGGTVDNVRTGVQKIEFHGGLEVLSKIQFYQSYWHTDGEITSEIQHGNKSEFKIDWIPDFGGEGRKYCSIKENEMSQMDSVMGNMTTFTKGKQTITSFGGEEGMTIKGLCGYLSKVLDLNDYDSPLFSIDISGISNSDASANRQCKSDVIMTADKLISEIISEDTGLDYYFLPSKKGYTIKVFKNQNSKGKTSVDVTSVYCRNFTLSTLTQNNYTAIRVIGERIKVHWKNDLPDEPTRDAYPVIDYDGRKIDQKIDNQDPYNSFSLTEKRKDWEKIKLPEVTINSKTGKASFKEKTVPKQTKYLDTLPGLPGIEHNYGTYAKVDVRVWNNRNLGIPIKDNEDDRKKNYDNVTYVEAHSKELQGDIGTIIVVNNWLRLCQKHIKFQDNGTLKLEEGQEYNVEDLPQSVKNICIPDIDFMSVCNNVTFELDQRVQCVFGKYKSEDRTLTVYQPGAELFMASTIEKDDDDGYKRVWKVVRNDFEKIKNKYNETIESISTAPCNFTAQFMGIYSPAILGTCLSVKRGGNVYTSKNSLTHITYIFNGDSTETRL